MSTSAATVDRPVPCSPPKRAPPPTRPPPSVPSSTSSPCLLHPLPPRKHSSSSSSATTMPPRPPQRVSSSSSCFTSTTLPRSSPSPCMRVPSSFDTVLPPPPPPPTARDAATSSAETLPYFCPKHVAVATRERPPFLLFFFQSCPDCRVRGFHEDQLPQYSPSSTASPPSPPPFLAPPPPPLHQDELQTWSPPSASPTLQRADFVDANVDGTSTQAAPIAAITRLPTVTISDDAEVICVLCANPLPRRGLGLPCGHLYHFSCIVPWLLRRNSCPVQDCHCRLEVPPSTTADTAPMTSSAFDSWHYFFDLSAEGAPQRRVGQQTARRPQAPSIDESLLDPPVRWGGPQAAASRASIAALATVTVYSDTAAVCAVCTDTLPLAASACRLPCGHLYHSGCIVPWLLLRNSCPVCRRSIPMCPSTTAETAPTPSLDPQPATGRSRRRSLPGARRIRRICDRLFTYMEASRARQSSM